MTWECWETVPESINCAAFKLTKQNPEFSFNNSMLVSPLSLPVEKCLLHVPGLGCSVHLGVCESQGLRVSHQMSPIVSPHFSRAVAFTLSSEAYYLIGAVMITQQPLEARRALQVLEYLVNYYQTSERNEGSCGKGPGKENVWVK